ncbi:DUF4129 domain-containing protein [Catellatospora tritici]|uniref:DUF4129 domain-containing protein n=1 Tax=Catellatospora tritici TaxID=2851566 RepID=UPI001C2DA722|nr:DUF4129 domain-containing protein [Catellatospora tritici]MBV1849478.1 DUF4129 domain-containing protein [Catellatospora tritici]MBV1854050.1 DUF4129 domain-containing protein [Catellatospora tritici]
MRWWNETVAAWSDQMSLGLTLLCLLVLAGVTGLLWYTWPAWLPNRWNLRQGWGSRAKRAKRAEEPIVVTEEQLDAVEAAVEELPEVAPVVFTTLADRLAAQGRYAEAVRERLRAMVRELVDRDVVTNQPGLTVTELARAAGTARPEIAPAVTTATETFSTIWYGKRPATADHDAAVRDCLDRVHEQLRGRA